MSSPNISTPREHSFVRALFAGSLLLALTSASLVRADSPAPLVEYNFDEGSGTTAANSGSLGSGSDLTLNFTNSHISWASPGGTVDGTGSALVMDGALRGTNLGFATANGADLNTNLSAFTITLWVNLSSPTASDRLVAFTDGTNGFDLRLNTVAGNNSTLSLTVNGSSSISSVAAPVSGGWAFIAVSYDGTQSSNNVSYYSGTSLVTTALLGSVRTTNAGAVNTLDSTNLASDLRIGSAYGTAGSDRTPAGSFDDVSIYGSALDLADIQAIQASAIPEPATTSLLIAGAGLFGAAVLRRRRRS